jgi:hypothetical protein
MHAATRARSLVLVYLQSKLPIRTIGAGLDPPDHKRMSSLSLSLSLSLSRRPPLGSSPPPLRWPRWPEEMGEGGRICSVGRLLGSLPVVSSGV